MADQKIVTETALSAFASDVKGELINKIGYDELPTIIDNEPYNFRPTANGKGVGDRETDKLIGGSVAFNQLVEASGSKYTATPATASKSYDSNTNTVSFVAGENYTSARLIYSMSSFEWIAGHKYLLSATIKNPSINGNFYFEISRGWVKKSLPVTANTTAFLQTILEPTSASDTAKRIQLYMAGTPTADYSVDVQNLQCIDLTQMFGSTIADYIYSLEQGTTGAGVAYFRKLFPKSYYAYNAGELMSVKTSAHNMTGFNQWDEETDIGDIDATTGANKSGIFLRAKNYTAVIPNVSYYAKTPDQLYLYWYDASKNYLGHSALISNVTFTTPSNCYFIRFVVRATYGTTYKHDICINLSWDGERNGEYEPYELNSYPLDSDLELRGIPKLDANNNLYYDGDEYTSDGTVTRKYGIYTITGNETFSATDVGQHVISNPNLTAMGAKPTATINDIGNIICDFAENKTYSALNVSGDTDGIGIGTSYLIIGSKQYDNWNNLVGKKIYFELATPTTETADAYQNPQICDGYGTEEYVDNRAVAIPVGHETEYVKNMDRLLLPATPTADGTYTLKCTVSGGTPTLSWVADT